MNKCNGAVVLGKMPYYAVARGRTVGVFGTWAECEAQVKGHSGARYKKFDTEQLARAFIAAEGGQQPAPAARAGLKRKTSDEHQLSVHLDRFESKLRAAAAGTERAIRRATSGTLRRAVLVEPQGLQSDAANGGGEWQLDSEGFVRVWTDGSCLSNGRRGARAGIGVWWGAGHPDNVSAPCERNTNNGGEVLAAARALSTAAARGVRRVAVHTDSQYLVRAATQWLPTWRATGWRRANGQPLLNIKEFQELDRVWGDTGLQVKWVHVPAHRGHTGNEAADALARAGALMGQHRHSYSDDDES